MTRTIAGARRLGLAPFTLRDARDPEAVFRRPESVVAAAAAGGLDAVGIFVMASAQLTPIAMDRQLRTKVLQLANSLGVEIVYVEALRIHREIDMQGVQRGLEAAAEMGAHEVLCTGYDPEGSRLAESLTEIAELAAPLGIRTNIEFFPMSLVPDVPAAIAVVESTRRADVGIVVDAMHVHRSGGGVADLRAIAAARIHLVHFCDGVIPAPGPDGWQLDVMDRRHPGDGGIPLADYVAAIPMTAQFMLECPVLAESDLLPETRVRRAVEGARRVLG